MVTTIFVNVSASAVQKERSITTTVFMKLFYYHLKISRNGFVLGNEVIFILQVLPRQCR